MTQKPATPNWNQFGVAIGTILSILAAILSGISSESAREQSGSAKDQVVVTQQMLDQARARAAKIEAELTDLEVRVQVIEKTAPKRSTPDR